MSDENDQEKEPLDGKKKANKKEEESEDEGTGY